jgi:type I restriction enzyme S subunit
MILDQVDDLRRKRKAVLRLLERLRLAIFHDLFGDPGALSGRWPLVTIGDLLSSAQYGTSAKAESDGTLPILRMNNITYDGNLDLSDLKFLDLPEREMDKYTVSDGDILFNRTNSPELVGKTAVVKNAGPMAFAGYLVRLRTNEKANSEYISAFLNSPFGKKVLRGMAKSIIGMANINAREVQTIRITCPPINLQRKFATLLAELDSLKSVQTAHLTKLSALFASLRHRAFNGELSVKAAERELAEAG